MDWLLSKVLEKVKSVVFQEAESGIRLVVGVKEDVDELSSTFQTIQAVLEDAEKRQVKEKAVRIWLDKLRSIAYDMEAVLDEWNTAILKSQQIIQVDEPSSSSSALSSNVLSLTPLPSYPFSRLVQRRDIADKIKELNERLEPISKEKDDFAFLADLTRKNNDPVTERPKTTYFVDASEIRGRGEDKDTLISLLLSEKNPRERGIPIISIVGMGGIGKTTLAQVVYNHHEVTAYFQRKIWVCVSDPFDEMRIATAILESLTGTASGLNELNSVLKKIHESIVGKRYLLVLDDVWNEDVRKWQSLKYCLQSGSQGSKILVTTREEDVAAVMGCKRLIRLGKLSQEECRSLFSQIALSGRNDRERESLEDIGKKLADRCQGLPLAAKTLGGLLRFKESGEEWQRVLDSHMWELDEAEKALQLLELNPPFPSSLMLKRKREFTYGIFLSFHGKDTRKRFTGYLYSALTRQRIETFRDDKSLKKGKDFAPELLRAIRESWGSIIVISETYAFSRWCLEELVEIMKQRKKRGHEVYPIFYHVPPSDFRHQINRVKEAFDKHEERYSKETTEAWRDALKEVTTIHGWSLHDQYESDFIDGIVKNVSEKIDAEDEKEVETMKKNLQRIQAWLVDAENKKCMKEGEAEKVWLDDKLKHIAYDMDDVLDEWNTAILKSKIEKDQPQTPISLSSLSEVQHSVGGRDASFSGLPYLNLPAPESNIPSTFFHSSGTALCDDIVLRIKKLNEECQLFIKDLIHFSVGVNDSYTDFRLERPKTVSFIDESVVYGRDHDRDALIHLLLSDDNSEGGTCNGVPLLAIVGMRGIGKTTLAQLAYNNEKVKKHFHQRIWVCVLDPFDVMRIAKAILETLTGSASSPNDLNSALEKIHESIAGKRYLLVLDDVWNEDERKWQYLKCCLQSGSQGSKILVTTRKEDIAAVMGCTKLIRLGKLSQEECWSLFSQIALSERNDRERESLEDIGKKIAERCQGLPLVAKTLGGLLRFKKSREEWQRVLDSPMGQLDKVEKDLFSTLLLSYYDLPSPLRQCFSYCAIFPKDHRIEKDLLIKYWMAQGFLGEGSNMEIVGEEYFDNLAARSFFQEFEKDEDDDSGIISCKMDGIVHDFAQLLRKTECCIVLASSEERGADHYHENVCHLRLIGGIPDLICNVKRLRSLLIDGYWLESWPESFNQLTCLRKLDLRGSSIRVLPPEIGSLIHLRYLCLEGNWGLVELPEALCDLCNLQTLNIRRCSNLQKLPCGMEKLINLRHLQNAGTDAFMPKRVQRLTCLQTLEWLKLEKKGGNESETSFRLADLGNLIRLRGSLTIDGLGNVGKAEVSEAREAPLFAKAKLRELTLNFDEGYYKEPQRRIEDEASVLQALEPPQHLRKLAIAYLEGLEFPFPNWMTSLTWLKSVELGCCDNWESLPPMGKLPYLESLCIEQIDKVKKVGEEFLGLETSTSSSSSSVNHNNITAFPNLKKLKFHYMEGWKEWDYADASRSRGDNSSCCSSSSSSNITIIMPKLQCLSMAVCPRLKTLPRPLLQSRALQELEIRGCPILERRFNKETGRLSISHIPNIYISPW